jgi:hypothetical protein
MQVIKNARKLKVNHGFKCHTFAQLIDKIRQKDLFQSLKVIYFFA